MKAKRYLFLILGAGLLIYGIAQICVTTWQIYSNNFATDFLTHPKILLMGGVHFAAAFLGLASISWSWKVTSREERVAEGSEPLAAPKKRQGRGRRRRRKTKRRRRTTGE